MLLPTTILSAAILLSNLLLTRCSAWTQEDVLALHGKFLSGQELQFLKRRLQMMHQNGAYSDTIDELFNNRNEINRMVQLTENGLVATTTSTSAYVTSLIQTHVADMQNLQFPIRQGDPLFVSLFDNIEQTQLEVQNITNGVNVSNTGLTDCGVILVQEHAAQVSSFVETGIRRPNFDWKEPDVCKDSQPSESSPMTTPTSPTLSSVTMPPTLLATAQAPVASPTTIPPQETTANSTISSTSAKKNIAIVGLLNVFILFLY